MRLAMDLPTRALRCVFCLLMVLSWSGATRTAQAQTAAAASPGAGEPTARDMDSARASLESTCKLLEAVQKDLPREGFDPKAVVESNGRDPSKLTAWVRDHTSWVPYRGVLRGPIGVLQDRCGGTLDRTLLLAELLTNAGREVRLGSVTLDPNSADVAAMTATLLDPKQDPATKTAAAAPPTEAEQIALTEAFARKHGFDPEQLKRGASDGLLRTRQLAAKLAARVADQSEALTDALGQLPAAEPAADPAAQAIQDHWFLQHREPGGAWVTADLLLPNGLADAQMKATRWTDYKVVNGRLPVDDANVHTVQVHVVVERMSRGKRSEAVALKQTLRPAEILGKRVTLFHHPTKWPSDLMAPEGQQLSERLIAAMRTQPMWVPILSIDGTPFYEAGVAADGSLDPKPPMDPMGQVGKSLAKGIGGAADLLGNLGDPPAANADPSVWTAEWIEIETRQPGQPPTIERRDVFDLLGPAARSAGKSDLLADGADPDLTRGAALFGRTELLIAPCRLSPDFVQNLAIDSLMKARTPLLDAMSGVARGDAKAASPVFNLESFPTALYNYAMTRFMVGRVQQAVYLDRVNVAAFHQRLVPGAAADQPFSVREIFDVIFNDIAVRHAWRADARRIRLEQGVIDTNAEVLATTRPQKENLPAVFERAADEGVASIVLRSNDDPNWAKIQLPAEAAARIRADLKSGQTIVVPAKAVSLAGTASVAWWRVDPASGRCLGMTSHGGATMAEKAALLAVFVGTSYLNFHGCGGTNSASSAMKKVGCGVCAIAMGALTTLALASTAGIGVAGAGAAGGLGGAAGGVLGGGLCNILSGSAS